MVIAGAVSAGSVPMVAGLVGCFGNSTSNDHPAGLAPKDGGDANAGSLDGTIPDATTGPGGDASGGLDGAGPACEAGTPGCSAEGGAVVCVPSTCGSVKVVFNGWIPGADGGIEDVPLAVDTGTPDGGVNGTVVDTANTSDPAIGHENLLYGDFVTTGDAGAPAIPLQYANDNNYCNIPIFDGRTNTYYLAPMQGLPVDPTFYAPQCGCGGTCGGACVDGGACDYESLFYSQTCPNFGGNCVITPRKIESIDVIANGADPTCKVCFYSSTSPSTSTVLGCVSPGTSIPTAGAPVLLRLDDGTGCASY